MHLRPATPADLPRCATIWDDAFIDDELFIFLAPHAAKYPFSHREYSLAKQRNNFYSPRAWNFVCVADSDDTIAADGEILGYATWQRSPSKEDASSDPWTRKFSPLEQVERWLRWAEFKWITTLRTNPSISWVNTAAFQQHMGTSDAFAAIRSSTHWFLSNLAVAPEYQRRGVARLLLQWGLGHAASETEQRVAVGKTPVPIGLIASYPGLPMYRKLGFKVVNWESNEILDFEARGGSDVVWDPTGYWIEDVPYEAPMARGVIEAVFKTKDSKE